MSRSSWIWLASLALAYIAFLFWYGGNGDPLTKEEASELLARVEAAYDIEVESARPGSLTANLAEMAPKDDGREFYAVNLEQLKDSDAGREADERYSRAVIGLLLERAGHPVLVGDRAGLMLGEYGEKIDRVAIVRYRSLRDLFDMVLDPRMQVASADKSASLDHTEVFIVRPFISLMQMRVLVGFGFAIVAALGLLVLRQFKKAKGVDRA